MISLPWIYLKLVDFPVKRGLIREVGGVSKLFFIRIFLFFLLGSPCKNLKLVNFPVKIGLNGGGRGPPKKFLIGILIFMLFGSPRKNLEPYDKPFWNIFENSPFSGQNRVNWGGRGGHRNSFFIGILLFLLLRSPCKNSEP